MWVKEKYMRYKRYKPYLLGRFSEIRRIDLFCWGTMDT